MTESSDEAVLHFGRAVKTRREELGLSQSELAGILGRPVGTLSAIEQGRRKTGVTGRTQAALDRALQWQAGSSRSILAGGEPVPLRPPHGGVRLELDADPSIRLLLDEVSMTADSDRERLVKTLIGAVRAWRDQPS